MNTLASTEKPKIVIVGAGFGGLFAAKATSRLEAEVTLVDRRNYHLFQPLLYQVAAAALAPSDIAWPIRALLSRQRNASVLMDEVTGINAEGRRVLLGEDFLPYDALVIATGVTHSYFGHPDWEAVAPGLKTLDDATLIRKRVLLAFERAEMSENQAEVDKLLTFVVVGGGPTGVELAGTIAELARFTLAADFRRIDSRRAKVLLVEAGSRVLPAFHESLSSYAHRSLERLGVEVCLGSPVTACDDSGVVLGEERIAAATVIWAAGVAATPVGRWLDVKTDRAGKVIVEADLSIPGHPDIFVIGDAALARNESGQAVPGIAPAAKQQGRYVAAVIGARLGNRPKPPAFRYRNVGSLATIGRKSAVIEFPGLRLRGLLAWWIWGVAHIYFLLGVPSPLLVSLRWLWEYVTYGRGARLITGDRRTD